MELPKNTANIFEHLQRGLFINSNSTDENIRKMFLSIEEHYEPLYEYFAHINHFLEQGNGFYYFSRKEPKDTLQQKIERAFYWIDIIDFFKTYDETFGTGYRFSASKILVESSVNPELQMKLDSLKKHSKGNEKRKEILNAIIERLVKESFFELENEISSIYKVMNAWNYLEQLIKSINFTEEDEHEISE